MDAYVENPALLAGKPKLTIGDYVESEGEPVAGRFKGLDEALASGKDLIIRSEHIDEYNGPSGLLESIIFARDPRISSEERTRIPWTTNEMLREALTAQLAIGDQSKVEELIRDHSVNTQSYQIYCFAAGEDPKAYAEKISYSYWEFLPGANMKVVADTALPQRYHLQANMPGCMTYLMVEDGRTILGPEKVPPTLIKESIEQYERVRRLPAFDPQHCPIIELQHDGKAPHFLQYHRGQDAFLPEFTLDRPPEQGEIVAQYIRGATAPEGAIGPAAIIYPDAARESPDIGTIQGPKMFHEAMTRRMRVQLLHCFDTWKADVFSHIFSRGHVASSLLFKPKVTAAIDNTRLYTPREFPQLQARAYSTGKAATVDIRVISDGRKCYVKRLDR